MQFVGVSYAHLEDHSNAPNWLEQMADQTQIIGAQVIMLVLPGQVRQIAAMAPASTYLSISDGLLDHGLGWIGWTVLSGPAC